MTARPAMTEDQAKSFNSYSATNAATLQGAAAARGCQCEPYNDWYTYARWQAQGFQVRKGEHAARLPCFAPVTRKDPTTGETVIAGKRPWTAYVFCRHQVDPQGSAPAPKASPSPMPEYHVNPPQPYETAH